MTAAATWIAFQLIAIDGDRGDAEFVESWLSNVCEQGSLVSFSKRINSAGSFGPTCDHGSTYAIRFVLRERLVVIASETECEPMGYRDRCGDGMDRSAFSPREVVVEPWVRSVESRPRAADPDRWFQAPWSSVDRRCS